LSSSTDQLWSAVESYVAAELLELDDLVILGEGSGRIVRITLDGVGKEPSLAVDRIADLSRGISRVLDDLDLFQSAYTLEVSSPGLERKLRRPRHFEKALGREIKVKTHAPVDGERTHHGVLKDAGETTFVLDVAGEDRSLGYDAVASARTVFLWEAPVKPGKRS